MKSWNCTIVDAFFWEQGEDSDKLDTSFVPMMLRRRCSEFTKLCFSASRHCIKSGEEMPVISVSKYGEIQRQYAISKKLIETKEVSPTAFSFSVFNTAIALLGISLKNHSSALALCTMHNQLEAGFIHALSFLESHTNEEKLLLLIGEEQMPQSYQAISAETHIPFIAAFLLSLDGFDYTVDFFSTQRQEDSAQGEHLLTHTKHTADYCANPDAACTTQQTDEDGLRPENYRQCKRFVQFIHSKTGQRSALQVNRLTIHKNG